MPLFSKSYEFRFFYYIIFNKKYRNIIIWLALCVWRWACSSVGSRLMLLPSIFWDGFSHIRSGIWHLSNLGCLDFQVQIQMIFLCINICMLQDNHSYLRKINCNVIFIAKILKNCMSFICVAQFQSQITVFATTTVLLQADWLLCHWYFTFAGLFQSIKGRIRKSTVIWELL